VITHTISIPELIWTLWCLVGLLYCLRLFWSSIQDWRYLTERGLDSIREYAAVNSVLIFATMTTTHLSFVVVGIVAMSIPPSTQHVIAPIYYVMAGIFMFTSSVKTLLAIIITTRKNNLVERIESGQWRVVKTGEK